MAASIRLLRSREMKADWWVDGGGLGSYCAVRSESESEELLNVSGLDSEEEESVSLSAKMVPTPCKALG